MITEETVLILGAGASCDFGYPSGRELKEQILKLADIQRIDETELRRIRMLGAVDENEKLNLSNEVIKLRFFLNNCALDYEKILRFKTDFSISPKFSIDTFLQNRREFLKLGKTLIAICIKKREAMTELFSTNNHWYADLFNTMDENWESFEKNKLSIITYNYDRSIEEYLVMALMTTYNKSRKECIEKVNKIQIIHVHGKLCDFDTEYTPEMTAKQIQKAADGLNIIVEGANQDIYSQVNKLLSKAKYRFILGFGYDERNLKNLRLDQYDGNFYSTRNGISNLQLQTITEITRGKIRFSGNENHKIPEFLKYEASLNGKTTGTVIRAGTAQFSAS